MTGPEFTLPLLKETGESILLPLLKATGESGLERTLEELPLAAAPPWDDGLPTEDVVPLAAC